MPTYHEESVQNIVLEAFLKQIYNMYKLFNGTFTNTLAEFNREALVHKLDMFFPQYIQTLDYEHGDVVDAFNGIQFLPLDKNTYLRIQCFVNLTESAFDAIKYSVFVYNDHLVWSGLEQDDMRVLYRYLTQGSGANGSVYFVPVQSTSIANIATYFSRVASMRGGHLCFRRASHSSFMNADNSPPVDCTQYMSEVISKTSSSPDEKNRIYVYLLKIGAPACLGGDMS